MSDYTFLNFHDELYKLWQIVQNTPFCYGKSPCPTFLSLSNYRLAGYGTDYYNLTLKDMVNYAKVIYDTLKIYDNPIDGSVITYESALTMLGETEEQRIGNAWFQQQYRLIELARYWKPCKANGTVISLYSTRSCYGSDDDYATAMAAYLTRETENGYPSIEPSIHSRKGDEDIVIRSYFSYFLANNVSNYDQELDPLDKAYSSDNHGRLIIKYLKTSTSSNYNLNCSTVEGIPDTVSEDSTAYEEVDFCDVTLPALSLTDYTYEPFGITFKDVPYIADKTTTSNISDYDIIGDLHPELDETENEETEE